MGEVMPGSAVVTIGVFDGVHRGHRALLAAARHEADNRGLPAIAVTFDPHPVAVLAPEKAPKQLTTVSRRVQLLREAGADVVRVLAFSAQIASWTPLEFINSVIVNECGGAHVVVGKGFRFGRGAAGDIAMMQAVGNEYGFTAEEADLTGDTAPFSSTRIRAAIAAGDLVSASDMLGRYPEVSGTVVRGDQRGRSLGFPTANVIVDELIATPPDGVYAGWMIRADGSRLPAAISVGTNPTFAGTRQRRVESFVMDQTHDLDLYDEQVRVEFVGHVRAMAKFGGIDELIDAMHRDVGVARKILAAG